MKLQEFNVLLYKFRLRFRRGRPEGAPSGHSGLMKYFVYILKSQKTNRFYIGCTANLEERLKKHNLGKTKSTKPYRPWMLFYKEEFDDKKNAYKREWHLKHPKGYLEKINIIKHGEVA